MAARIVERRSFYTIYEVYVEKLNQNVTFLFTDSRTNINMISMHYGSANQAKCFNFSFLLAVRKFDSVFTSADFVFGQLVNDEEMVMAMIECVYGKIEYEGNMVDISLDGKIHECELKFISPDSLNLW